MRIQIRNYILSSKWDGNKLIPCSITCMPSQIGTNKNIPSQTTRRGIVTQPPTKSGVSHSQAVSQTTQAGSSQSSSNYKTSNSQYACASGFQPPSRNDIPAASQTAKPQILQVATPKSGIVTKPATEPLSYAKMASPSLIAESVPVTLSSQVIRRLSTPRFDQPCIDQSVADPLVMVYHFDEKRNLIGIKVSPQREDLL